MCGGGWEGGGNTGAASYSSHVTHVVDDHKHDGFWHEVALRLVDDLHVGVDEVADRLHLALHLRVGRRQLAVTLRAQSR